jgi:hypothetical protein
LPEAKTSRHSADAGSYRRQWALLSAQAITVRPVMTTGARHGRAKRKHAENNGLLAARFRPLKEKNPHGT